MSYALGLTAIASLLESAAVIALQPWRWCNTTGRRCGVASTLGLEAVLLALGMAVSVLVWKRKIAPMLLLVGALLIIDASYGLLGPRVHAIGGYVSSLTAAPAALWFACGVLQFANGSRLRMVLGALMATFLMWVALVAALDLVRYSTSPLRGALPVIATPSASPTTWHILSITGD